MQQVKTSMQSQLISLDKIKANTGQIPGLPKNPRLIKDDRYQKLLRSIQDDPEMMQLRELIVFPYQDEFIVIGGNMRLAVLQQLGYKEAPCKVLPLSTSIEKLKAYSIKDNVNYGDWNMETLIDEWDSIALTDWGLEMPDLNTEMVGQVNDQDEWQGLPDFDGITNSLKIIVQFETEQDREDFNIKYNLRAYKFNKKTWTTWFPWKEREDLASLKYDKASKE